MEINMYCLPSCVFIESQIFIVFNSLKTLQMGLVSFPSSTFCSRMFSNSLPFISESTKSHNKPSLSNPKSINNNPLQAALPYQPLISRQFSSRHAGLLSLVPFVAKNTGSSEEEDHRALETVLKLYTAIKNKNILELSDIIGDECRCVCNFFSFFQPLNGKKQVLDFFSYLIKSLGNNIEFVVQPILHDGMNVGVSWRLEWRQTHFPLGKGFSFYICHIYHGKAMIRNVEMFMEPLLHIEPFRLKTMGYVMAVLDKMGSFTVFEGKAKRAVSILLTVFLMAAFLFSLKFSLY